VPLVLEVRALIDAGPLDPAAVQAIFARYDSELIDGS
jgi:hypothetical protein